jgi:hypothetical protein
MIGDAALGVNGDEVSVAGGQVVEVMGTAFRGSEWLLAARA